MKPICRNCRHYYRVPYGHSETNQHYRCYCSVKKNKRGTDLCVKGNNEACWYFKAK